MHIDGNVKFQIKPDPQDADAVLHLVTLCRIPSHGMSLSPDVIGWPMSRAETRLMRSIVLTCHVNNYPQKPKRS